MTINAYVKSHKASPTVTLSTSSKLLCKFASCDVSLQSQEMETKCNKAKIVLTAFQFSLFFFLFIYSPVQLCFDILHFISPLTFDTLTSRARVHGTCATTQPCFHYNSRIFFVSLGEGGCPIQPFSCRLWSAKRVHFQAKGHLHTPPPPLFLNCYPLISFVVP